MFLICLVQAHFILIQKILIISDDSKEKNNIYVDNISTIKKDDFYTILTHTANNTVAAILSDTGNKFIAANIHRIYM